MPLYLFYTMVQKSQKWPKTQIKGGGGPALMRKKANIWSVVEDWKVWHHNPLYLWLAFRYHKWKFMNIWE